MEEQRTDWSASHVKEYFDKRLDDRDKLDAQRERRIDDALEAAQQATAIAKTESSERLTQHNGLIQKMEDQADKFVTHDSFDPVRTFQNKLAGGLIVVSFIGVINLVKLWFT